MDNFCTVLEYFLRDCQSSMTMQYLIISSIWHHVPWGTERVSSTAFDLQSHLRYQNIFLFLLQNPFFLHSLLCQGSFVCLTSHLCSKGLWYHLNFNGFRKNVSNILLHFWSVRAPQSRVLKILLTHHWNRYQISPFTV